MYRHVWVQRLAAFAVPLVMSFALATSAHAAIGLVPIVPCGVENAVAGQSTQPCSVCDLSKLAQNILVDGIYLSVFLTAILFAWAGFKMLTSGGNETERNKGKQIFLNVAIGFTIMLAAWLVVGALMGTFLGTSVEPWNSVC